MAILKVDGYNPYTAQGVFPRRFGGQLSGTCIVHTSEGNWQNGVNALTALIKSRADHGAYHRGVDWEDIAPYFDWEWECWQDMNTNPWAVGISAACKTSDWGVMPDDIEEGFYRNLARCGADFVVYMKDTRDIDVPLMRISGNEARSGVPGFCAHGDSGTSRSDPGSNFDWERFFRYISEELDVSTEPTVEEIVALTLQEIKEIWSNVGTGEDRKKNFEWIAELVTSKEFPVIGADGKPKVRAGKPVRHSIGSFLTWFDSGIDTLFGQGKEIKDAQKLTNEKLDTIITLLTEKK